MAPEHLVDLSFDRETLPGVGIGAGRGVQVFEHGVIRPETDVVVEPGADDLDDSRWLEGLDV
jgi:hypothetical protein